MPMATNTTGEWGALELFFTKKLKAKKDDEEVEFPVEVEMPTNLPPVKDWPTKIYWCPP
jgi:hypothetical protein